MAFTAIIGGANLGWGNIQVNGFKTSFGGILQEIDGMVGLVVGEST
jgi:hypothetical protein